MIDIRLCSSMIKSNDESKINPVSIGRVTFSPFEGWLTLSLKLAGERYEIKKKDILISIDFLRGV